MAYVVGDTARVRYEVRDPSTGALTDAAVTAAVTKPDGMPLVPDPTPVHVGVGVYDASWTLTVAGTWRWAFTATGAVADTTDAAVYVWPVGATLPWVPTRRQVAKYVPERTVPVDQTSDAPFLDFADDTQPTAVQADEHIAAAVAWVAVAAGAVAVSLYAAAAEVAAVRAAGMVELSYPVRNADIDTAAALLGQADAMLAGLVEANEAAVSGDTQLGVLAQWFMPRPVSWGDSLVF